MSSTPDSASTSGRGLTPPDTAPSSRRQSCDRCHGQKLRCTRLGNSTSGACNRCLRQSAQCTYSPSLPKGRPRTYRPTKTFISTPPPSTSNSGGDPMVEDDTNSTSNSSSSGGPDYDWTPPITWNDVLGRSSGHDSTPNDPNSAFLDAFPNLSSWGVPIKDGEGEGELQQHDIHPALPEPNIEMHFGGDMLDPKSSSSSMASGDGISIPNADENGPDVGIAQLSQLSTRLYPLYRSSCTLAEAAAAAAKNDNSSCTASLIDDAALRCVASWLIHGTTNMSLFLHTDHQYPPMNSPTAGETLYGAICGAHQLLEILQSLQRQPMSGATTGTSSPNSTCIGGTKSGFRVPDIAPTPFSVSSNTVVRHLVTACHTLLLNIYNSILFALQHDIDLRGVATKSAMSNNIANPSTLADIRLVMVVQLYSYVLSQLHQAVRSHFTPIIPTPRAQSHNECFSPDLPPIPTTGPLANEEGVGELKIEVQQRLARLRQALFV